MIFLTTMRKYLVIENIKEEGGNGGHLSFQGLLFFRVG